jgi:hypothetical protein
LSGLDALQDFLAEGLGFDALDEVAGDFEIDVGFEQGEADFAERIAHVVLGNLSESAKIAECVLEPGA